MLIFALAVTAVLLTIVFGYVRVVELQRNAGSAQTAGMLARETALAGTSEAIAQILRDHASPDEPVTRLDGPAHAMFRAMRAPGVRDRNRIDPQQPDPRLIGLNDVPAEDLMPSPGVSLAWSFQRGGYAYGSIDLLNPALSSWDGRARWYELGMSNPAVEGSASVPPGGEPTAGAVRFSDGDGERMDARHGDAADAVALTPPARCAPIMYDRRWRRMDYATPAEAVALRTSARHRLRYAVGVRDLQGTLLLTPDAGFDPRSITGDPDPRNYADPAVARVLRAWHAFPNTVNLLAHSSAQVVGRVSAGVRAGHVLIGRGSAANYDRRSAADPWPRTFPLMYRGAYENDAFWRHLRRDPKQIGVGFPWFDAPDTVGGPFTGLFANSVGGATGLITAGMAPGGEQIANRGPGWAWRHAQTGAPQSPFDACMAMAGGQELQDGSINAVDGLWEESMLLTTPFGRGTPPGGAGADTPWTVNPLTAPMAVLRAVVLGSLPAGVLQTRFQLKPAPGPMTGAFDGAFRSAGTNSQEYWGGFRTRSLWVVSQSPAFARYPPPARRSGGTPTGAVLLSPDYHVPADRPGPDPVANPGAAEEGFLHPALRYPGPVAWNIVERNAHTGAVSAYHDDLGIGIDISDRPLIRDVHHQPATFGEDDDKHAVGAVLRRACNTPQSIVDPFVTEMPDDQGWSGKDGAQDFTPVNNGFIGSDSRWDRMGRDYAGTRIQVHPDSYYRDILHALSNALAMARMANTRYPVGAYTPAAGDVAHSGVLAARPVSAAAIDAIFLRCLGTDIAAPAGGPVAGWCGDAGQRAVAFTPSANLATRAADAAFFRDISLTPGAAPTRIAAPLLTQVMERMVNDLRLSLFGSHPSYAAAFRPLDLNGDGRAACSGYPADPLFGPGTPEHACHVEQSAPAPGGIGPAVSTAFSIAGNLVPSRSRFWEVWVRGEVFDNVAKRTLAQATVQSVVVVDPRQGDAAADHRDTHVIYRRWHFNLARGQQSGGF